MRRFVIVPVTAVSIALVLASSCFATGDAHGSRANDLLVKNVVERALDTMSFDIDAMNTCSPCVDAATRTAGDAAIFSDLIKRQRSRGGPLGTYAARGSRAALAAIAKIGLAAQVFAQAQVGGTGTADTNQSIRLAVYYLTQGKKSLLLAYSDLDHVR